MGSFLKSLCLLLSPLTVTACSTLEQPVSVALAITNVTVIDPAGRSVRQQQDVFIDGERIVAVVPTGSDARYDATRSVDGSGRYLIPGLMDMHVHVAHPHFSESTLKLLLVNGVTGVREMSGDCWEPRGEIFACIDDYRELQAAIEAGKVPAPHLLRISSAIVRGDGEAHPPHVPEGAADFMTPSTPAEARQLVGYLVERGVDFIKTYNAIPPETYLALLEEAARRGIEVSGHVPLAIDVVTAAEHGHRTIEHARSIVYDCSGFGPGFRDMVSNHFAGDKVEWIAETEQERRSIDSFDAEQCGRILERLADLGTYYVPTHETREMDAMASDAGYRDDQRLQFVPKQLREDWQRDLERTAAQSPEAVATHREFFEHGLKVTQLAHAAGVNVMAGTDANDTMSIPGFGLHDELQHLVDAGLSPMEALRSATVVPARYLGREAEFGSIAAGYRADLVLLDADPLSDIANTTAIAAVIFKGSVGDRAGLDQLLASVKSAASSNWWDAIEIPQLSAATLGRYAGVYVVPSSGLEINVKPLRNGLQVTANGMPVIQFLPETETLFFMKEDSTKFEFEVDADGKVVGLKVIWSGGRSEFAPKSS